MIEIWRLFLIVLIILLILNKANANNYITIITKYFAFYNSFFAYLFFSLIQL